MLVRVPSNRRVTFFGVDVRYEKPPTTLQQQIQRLIDRGMRIDDPDVTYFFLTHIGYYRLRGYWIPFENPESAAEKCKFQPGVTFKHVLSLYAFDRELRLLIIDAVERVEISVRNQWVEVLATQQGAHAYLQSDIFRSHRQYGRSLAELAGEVERSKEVYIRHYKKKYDEPDMPPLWAAAGTMTLGQFSHWFSNLKGQAIKAVIAKVYGLDESVLESFLHHLTVIRNICAHHGRLWNSELTVTMKLPRTKPKDLAQNMELGTDPNQAPRKLYNTLVMLAYLMDIISPRHHWKHRLKCLIDQHGIDTRQMGFPSDFMNRPIWVTVWQGI
jgi:abortive infection bacteriophage resistance protein